jgi:hypothetical protein
MSRKFLIPLVAAAFLAAPAFAPAPIAAGLSGSAQAADDTKKSNTTNRMGGGPGKKAAPATTKTAPATSPTGGRGTY